MSIRLSFSSSSPALGDDAVRGHEPNKQRGQVTGNIVSEWVETAGLVFLTKRFIEIGSKE